jgi:hypothetical protein
MFSNQVTRRRLQARARYEGKVRIKLADRCPGTTMEYSQKAYNHLHKVAIMLLRVLFRWPRAAGDT